MNRRHLTALCALLGAAGCSRPAPAFDPTVFLNPHPELPSCLASGAVSSVPRWATGTLEVRFAPSAPAPCPGPGFPFVQARGSEAQRWVQVVEANVETPIEVRADRQRMLNQRVFPWVFLDMEERLRGSAQPFVNDRTDGSFWDNPVWAAQPPPSQADGQRRWVARAYLVNATGRRLEGTGGFSWGWSWRVGALHPEAIAPARLEASSWESDARLLREAFPGWTFE